MNPSSEYNQRLAGAADNSIQSHIQYNSSSSDSHNLSTGPQISCNLPQLSNQDLEVPLEPTSQNISPPFFTFDQSPESLQSLQTSLAQVLTTQPLLQQNQQYQNQVQYQTIQHHQSGLQQFQQSQQQPLESEDIIVDFLDFSLPESHSNCVGQSVIPPQVLTAMGTESAPRGDIGVNGDGTTVEIIEQSAHLSLAQAPLKIDDSPRSSDKRANKRTFEPSPLSCRTQEKVPEILGTPITPYMPTIPTARGCRRTGRGKRQPLSTPPGVRIEELQLPVVQEDPLVKYCKGILLKKGKRNIEKDGLDLYNQRLECLEDATEKNKVLERQKLKSESEPVENRHRSDQASRIEAKLSRYRKEIFTVLSLEEWKKLREDCTVLAQYILTFILQRNVDSANCPRTGPSSADDFWDANTGTNTFPVKRRKFE